MLVIIDAGHGGEDPGAVGYVTEKEINLAVAISLKYVLNNNNIKVIYTRSDDSFISLQERYEMANRLGGDLFISIHCNAAENPAAQGSECYYYKGRDKRLAERLNKGVVEILGTRDRGIKHGKFAVIRKTTMPAVLLELGFVSNQEDGGKLQSVLENRDVRLELVNSLTKNIINYKKPIGIIKKIFKSFPFK